MDICNEHNIYRELAEKYTQMDIYKKKKHIQ